MPQTITKLDTQAQFPYVRCSEKEALILSSIDKENDRPKGPK
jgi:hypothetical protein